MKDKSSAAVNSTTPSMEIC